MGPLPLVRIANVLGGVIDRYLPFMPTDAERWRFLAGNGLTLHSSSDAYVIHWYNLEGMDAGEAAGGKRWNAARGNNDT